MVSILKFKLVKLRFCPGMVSIPIDIASSPIDEKLLFLHDDGSNELSPPSSRCLNKTIVYPEEINVISEDQFLTTLMAKRETYAYQFSPSNQVTTTATIMKVASIPPYFAYDDFDRDLDVGMVHEKILRHNNVKNMFVHLKYFFRVCLSSHNTADTNHMRIQRCLQLPL